MLESKNCAFCSIRERWRSSRKISNDFRLPTLKSSSLSSSSLSSRKASKKTTKIWRKESNNGLVLWSVFMSITEIVLILCEKTYNEVVATLVIFLAMASLILDRYITKCLYYYYYDFGHRQRQRRRWWYLALCVAVQVSLLFAVMSIIASCRKANNPIDSVAWNFLWITKEERKIFGSLFDTTNLVAFLGPVYSNTLKVSLGLAAIAWTVAKNSMAVTFLSSLCRQILQCVAVLASFVLMKEVVTIQAQNNQHHNPFLGRKAVEQSSASVTRYCKDPPKINFKRKPNIVIITIDSWRRDTVDEKSMPQTLEWLRETKKSIPGSSMLEWKNHDACAVNSDQGYVSLYYGMKGLKREKLQKFNSNPDIKSWLLQTAKDNGYLLHKVTPDKYYFCWLLMQNCDLYTRDFDTQNGVNMTEVPYLPKDSVWQDGGGSRAVFDGMEALLKDKFQRQDETPILISADLQDLHHPLPYEARQDISYTEPEISLHDLHLTYSGGLKITKENKAEIVQKLRNRVTNCLLNLDSDLANWLSRVQPFLDDTILILTGDHADLLFDGEENFIWHGVNNPIDKQRQVPMLFYGPTDILSKLQVPEAMVTCHSDVLPSLYEALSEGELDKPWKSELDYNSYYNIKSPQETSPAGFAYHSLHEFQVLIEGNRRLYLYNDQVKEAHYLDDDSHKKLDSSQIQRMTEIIHKIEKSTWPGWNSNDSSDCKL